MTREIVSVDKPLKGLGFSWMGLTSAVVVLAALFVVGSGPASAGETSSQPAADLLAHREAAVQNAAWQVAMMEIARQASRKRTPRFQVELGRQGD